MEARSVTSITKGSEEYEWDGETLFDHDELLFACPSLAYVDEITEESEAAKRRGPKSGAQTPAEPVKEEEALKEIQKVVLKKVVAKLHLAKRQLMH